ncbi:hypothetical protein [Devosia beringensis]|uniref:hypothetical protein n=1 Tax=Devosia beringensis TaxID=2657486 RepID=UPI00186B6CDA|nr:hypothetical protein [Devosia beringensis]
MSKSIDEQIADDLAKVDKTSGGGHLGGTEFGQSPGEAKVKHPEGDKTRPDKTSGTDAK